MKIHFALWGTHRTGGTRVIFEVANRLSRRGHNVVMTSLGRAAHPWFQLDPKITITYPESERTLTLPRRSQLSLTHTIDRLLKTTGLNYLVGKLVMRRMIFNRLELLSSAIPANVDVNIATHCFTAYAVAKSNVGRQFYYVQHYEPLFFEWNRALRQLAEASYSLPLVLITVSSWLQEQLKNKHGRDSHLCLNGVDRRIFCQRKTATSKKNLRIMVLGRNTAWKGMDDLTQALNTVYEQFSAFELVAVSQDPLTITNARFPFQIVKAESDEEMATEYSRSDIFVNPSWHEGFSLPTLEAMSCGVPVVTTSVGPADYAINDVNSLVVPPRKPKDMASAILRLINDDGLRRKLSTNAIQTSMTLTWDKSAQEIERILCSSSDDH